ncbi:hypothetical protein NGRA_1808 [Nosema granulosis]|uniref:RING-type domain-containing protein n=1 Tax=Nosema granulosis TaxID=83296 RepID=A0A9P6H134_9MICR|nr:hypothetical protein NGRA_1808 [Nosema granulosis]
MNDKEVLEQLLFCNLCYFPHKGKTGRSVTLLISYCMHLVCTSCMQDTRMCPVCGSETTFVQVSKSISRQLKKNVSELFVRPIDVSMFQISSAMSLVSFLMEEVSSYKKLLIMAKNEICKLKKPKKNLPLHETERTNDKYTNHLFKRDSKTNAVLNFSNLSTSSVNQRISLPKNFKPYKKYYRK